MDSNLDFRPLSWGRGTHAPGHVPQTPQPEPGPEAASSPLSAKGGPDRSCRCLEEQFGGEEAEKEGRKKEKEEEKEKEWEREDDKKHQAGLAQDANNHASAVQPASTHNPIVEQDVAETICNLETKIACNGGLTEADAAAALLDLAAQRPAIVEQRPCSSSKETQSHVQPGTSEPNPSLKSKPPHSTVAGDSSADDTLAEDCTLDDRSSLVSVDSEEDIITKHKRQHLEDLRELLQDQIELAVKLLETAFLVGGAVGETVEDPNGSSGDCEVALEDAASLSSGMSHDNDAHQAGRPDPTNLQHEVQKADEDLGRGRSMTPKDLTMTSINHGSTSSESPYKAEPPKDHTLEQTPHEHLPVPKDLLQRLVEEISKQSTASSYVGVDAQAAAWSAIPPDLRYVQYEVRKEDIYLDQIRQLISKDLSEPYSIYVYRYFLNQWPNLCFMALAKDSDELRGVIVCKLETHRSGTYRGYIAMLATAAAHRGQGIASHLIVKAIDAMRALDADEIVLETEVTNPASLRLYERLGFLRTKRLHRYYLSGNDAFRLALYLKPGVGTQGRQKQQPQSGLSSFHQSIGL